MKLAALQMTSGPDVAANLEQARALLEEAAALGARLAALPENFSFMGLKDADKRAVAEADGSGPVQEFLGSTARRLGLWIVGGTVPLRAGADGRVAAASLVYDADGRRVGRYDKIHLFDVDLDGTTFRESATMAPGDELVVSHLEPDPTGDLPATVVGLSICYDLRFPEPYRILALRGATVLVVPAAFTAATGPAHWELLLRARAVENEAFVIGAGQVGDLPPGMPACHGHTLVVDPWGTVIAERTEPTPGFVLAELDMSRVERVRSELPVLAHRRPEAYRWPDDDVRGTFGGGG